MATRPPPTIPVGGWMSAGLRDLEAARYPADRAFRQIGHED